MKQLSEGVTGYGKSKGVKVTIQDPKLDPQKQVTDLQTAIESGSVDGAWAIMLAPPAAASLVQSALAKGVPMILNGTPEDYGLKGLEPGVSFSTIDYQAQGTAWARSSATASTRSSTARPRCSSPSPPPAPPARRSQRQAIKAALAATAPDAEIVSTIIVSDRGQAQTDVGAPSRATPASTP
jgi:ABC-type sugar transport system substrate-binding protein